MSAAEAFPEGEILGIDLRSDELLGELYLRVGDEIGVLTFEENDDGIRWIEAIEIAPPWVRLVFDKPPACVFALAEVVKVWMR